MTSGISFKAPAIRPLILAAALAIGAVVFWWTKSRGADSLEAFLVALGIVVLIAVALWLAREGLYEFLDHRAIQSVNSLGRPPGSWVAVAGTAIARGDPIRATLSDRPALACSYKIYEKSFEGQGTRASLRIKLCYEGYHLAPTAIETEAGLVPLRGLPDLVNLEKSGIGHGGPHLEHVAERRSWFPPKSAARAHLAAQVQDRFDIDWYYGEKENYHSIDRREWVLPPGEQVCVFGRWDGQALVPSALRPRGLPVYAGPSEEVGRQLGGGSKLFFGLSLIPLLVAGWLVYGYAG